VSKVRFERTGGWDVQFHTYSGMSIPFGDDVSKDEAKDIIRRRLRRAKRDGQPVTKIAPGEWEFECPDDAGMMSDDMGVLTVRPHRRPYRVILGRRVY